MADAKLFVEGASSLGSATLDDIDRVQIRLSGSLATCRAIREDLEREENSIEAQCAERRESMDRTRLAR
jgi:hypothetical protein